MNHDHGLFISHEIGCMQIDDFLSIPPQPGWAAQDRHAWMWRFAH